MVYVVFERMFMVFYGKLLQAMILQCVSWKQTYITSLYNVMSLLERKEGGGGTGKYQIDLGFLFKITFKKKKL